MVKRPSPGLSRVCSLFLLFHLGLLFSGCSHTGALQEQEIQGSSTAYWPVGSWRTSSPEAQGIDPQKISAMIRDIRAGQKKIHSLLIVRNGYLITEEYFPPYSKDSGHMLYSCTKSVISALVGIAVSDGFIKGLDEKVTGYFTDLDIDNKDGRKDAITIKHLLEMSAGLDWVEDGNYGSPADSVTRMRLSGDQIKFVLDRPMKEDPGKTFYYCSGASHLLSGILQRTTGRSSFEYGKQRLFDPLGIKDISWTSDEDGISNGADGISMTPADMARFGYLFLRNGRWNNRQVVPAVWVAESTKTHIDTPDGLAGRYGYGYQWWRNRFGGYSARGYGGQYIFVIPEYDMVIVFTGELSLRDLFLPENLVEAYLISAVIF
ncbi:MAG: class C beta-lactamase-related serine hydrolase [Nitrospirae bacterium]|nr:MAG: class C beta-lactamase-related serine hydrolase [Nitrospirota bacterium]